MRETERKSRSAHDDIARITVLPEKPVNLKSIDGLPPVAVNQSSIRGGLLIIRVFVDQVGIGITFDHRIINDHLGHTLY
ncbi:hypothetical protein SAMN05421693_10766 [Ectothiorhodospira magna]|uniref:Uncharacterized protein n=1 Tax=Ectothiorhodospira magna TaxID=867345 RepID=A0A1H9B433_9GAMM|nr:hypothetical protein SAMN05421693_10766 [Ectothiorhodospira magna]